MSVWNGLKNLTGSSWEAAARGTELCQILFTNLKAQVIQI